VTAADRLQLLTRPGCHLCEDMATALHDLGLQFDLLNVDEDSALEAAYGDCLPVLMRGEHEVLRAPQSPRTLKRALRRSGVI
jgi:hypothetical protein